MPPPPVDPGVHLQRSDESTADVDALATLLGGRPGPRGLLDDLGRRLRRSPRWGLAVTGAWTWEREDRTTREWWPQGVSTADDSDLPDDLRARHLVAVSWYSRDGRGSRVTFADVDARRYRHVLLVVPTRAADGSISFEPLRVHAGGIVWVGPYLYVAATARGFFAARLDDVLRVPDEVASGDETACGVSGGRVSSYGCRWVLPVRFAYQGRADDASSRLRFSFLSLDRGADPPQLLTGEYGDRTQTRRLAAFGLDPDSWLLARDADGVERPLLVDEGGLLKTQGVTVARGTWLVTSGPTMLWHGTPGRWRRRVLAVPPGAEDLAYGPVRDELWTVTEFPRMRWLVSLRRPRQRGSRAS